MEYIVIIIVVMFMLIGFESCLLTKSGGILAFAGYKCAQAAADAALPVLAWPTTIM